MAAKLFETGSDRCEVRDWFGEACCIVLSVGVAENEIRWILELDETTEEISGVMDIFGFDYVTFLSFVSAMCMIT